MLFKTTTEFNKYIAEVRQLVINFGETGATMYLMGEGLSERKAKQYVIQSRNHFKGSNHI